MGGCSDELSSLVDLVLYEFGAGEMVEAGFQDFVGEILECKELAYRETIVNAGLEDACHYLESVSPQEVSCGEHKRVKIKSIGLFPLEKSTLGQPGNGGFAFPLVQDYDRDDNSYRGYCERGVQVDYPWWGW